MLSCHKNSQPAVVAQTLCVTWYGSNVKHVSSVSVVVWCGSSIVHHKKLGVPVANTFFIT